MRRGVVETLRTGLSLGAVEADQLTDHRARVLEQAGDLGVGLTGPVVDDGRGLELLHGRPALVHDRPGVTDLNALELLAGLVREEAGVLVDDELLETIAVVGEPTQVPGLIRARLEGISDSVSLVNNRAPDPLHLAEVVAGLREN